MGQGGQRHTSRATRAWLRSLTPGVGLSAGGARRGQLKQSGVLGLGRKRALAGPDCEWERAVRGVLLGRSNRQGGKCVAADWAAWVGAAVGSRCWLSTRTEATGRGMRGWSEALTGGPAGHVRVGVATLVCRPSWSDGEGARYADAGAGELGPHGREEEVICGLLAWRSFGRGCARDWADLGCRGKGFGLTLVVWAGSSSSVILLPNSNPISYFYSSSNKSI